MSKNNITYNIRNITENSKQKPRNLKNENF